MKKLGTVFAMICLFFAFAGPAKASFSYFAPSLPWSAPINQCIGGQLCGGTSNTIIVSTPSAFIRYVNVDAHDNIGDKHQALLEVYIDGVRVGSQDVLASGSRLYFPINLYGSTVTLRSVRADGSSDETYVSRIEILP
jgi:hypothetical protein